MGSAIGLLNQWRETHDSQSSSNELNPEAKRLLGTLISADELKRVASPRYNERDARHLRDSLLLKKVSDLVTKNARNDLAHVLALFNYVVENVELKLSVEDAVPLTLYHILVTGRGTSADRAWLFAELLRQKRIDTVILRPAAAKNSSDENKDNDRWLVGVLLDQQIFLFDTRLG